MPSPHPTTLLLLPSHCLSQFGSRRLSSRYAQQPLYPPDTPWYTWYNTLVLIKEAPCPEILLHSADNHLFEELAQGTEQADRTIVIHDFWVLSRFWYHDTNRFLPCSREISRCETSVIQRG